MDYASLVSRDAINLYSFDFPAREESRLSEVFGSSRDLYEILRKRRERRAGKYKGRIKWTEGRLDLIDRGYGRRGSTIVVPCRVREWRAWAGGIRENGREGKGRNDGFGPVIGGLPKKNGTTFSTTFMVAPCNVPTTLVG